MPQITITISQKVIDRAQVLATEHNAKTGESLTALQLAGRILRNWAAAQAVNTLATQALKDLDADLEVQREAGQQAIKTAVDTETTTWD